MRLNTDTTRPSARSGLSLVELLIVIAILGLLVTVMVVAMGPSLTSSRESKTRVTISQIDRMIQDRLQALERIDLKSEIELLTTRNPMRPRSNPQLSAQEAEVLIRKELYRQALPQSREHLFGLDGTAGTADDAPLLAILDAKYPANDATNSQVLYLALTEGKTVGLLTNGGTIKTKLHALPVIDPDSVGNSNITDGAFIDAWGQPLVFYAKPTRLVRPNGSGQPITAEQFNDAVVLLGTGLQSFSGTALAPTDNHPLNTDTSDPIGSLTTKWTNSPIRFDFNGDGTPDWIVRQWDSELHFGTPHTYSLPLVVSAGADESLGLWSPISTPSETAETGYNAAFQMGRIKDREAIYDNITNRQP